MCGLIIEHLGWEAVFYITAGITLLWVVIWQVGRIPRRPDIVNVIYPAVHKSLWYFFYITHTDRIAPLCVVIWRMGSTVSVSVNVIVLGHKSLEPFSSGE